MTFYISSIYYDVTNISLEKKLMYKRYGHNIYILNPQSNRITC